MILDRSVVLSVLVLGAVLTGCGGDSSSESRSPQGDADEIVISDPFRFPGFSEANTLRPVAASELNGLHSVLSTDLTRNKWNSCSERAHVWAYQQKARQIDTGKVFIFYTGVRVPGRRLPKRIAQTPAKRDWLWHTAPYVATPDGALHVLENFDQVTGPMKMQQWLSFQTSGQRCVELQGTEKEIMEWTCGKLTESGECTMASPKMIEVEEGGVPCYFRRVPSQYVYPRDVANHDFLGFAELKPTDPHSAYYTCMIVMGDQGAGTRSARCMALLSAPPSAYMGQEVVEKPIYGDSIQR